MLNDNATSIFDEMHSADGQIRPAYQTLANWLTQKRTHELIALNQKALALFYRKGVSFTVYGESQQTERIIPFDIIPRIIASREWNMLQNGCTQRIRALNAFLYDIYHKRDIIRANLIPEAVVLQNPCYQPWMMNLDLPTAIYAHVSGIDLIRDNDGEYYVLEDNLRTPSGVSYMIEGRLISQRLLGDTLDKNKVLPVDNYPSLLKSCLVENSQIDDPFIVVLTPGRYNSAYYEHTFLAREMGVPLVHGYDLYVENNGVYLRTTSGPKRVDIIYRRIDDDFLDPLVMNPNSVLGVPGLMAAYRSGQVIIANAPGTGVADDKSIYPYVNEMIKFYLGEQPILHNVPTWLCRDKADLDYVLAHLDTLVVKEAQGSGGYGMLIGPKSSKAEIAAYRARILADPAAFIAQPTLALSTCPTCTEEGIAPRHIDLRPFVLSSPDKIRLSAGGLTRVALRDGSLVVNSSQGGGVKDTWVTQENSANSVGQGE
ncbi:circularly permuted type 2 ATP-grasp protein [Ostreibacterium oceani]|uniref:Circularly permuted type 2 ATP-grasp protein n=1 Tax=Ostreibacterium oceani TaxID=2654998 RepID=A0A6N7EYI2_9GAMM|nr:circularly permuted type 2 ATP-grasp protein [Ostreibacterium oceani]MPV86197.1 circularly permuted type 2 ATP-grasp protein [Ostreibacterium oceani]